MNFRLGYCSGALIAMSAAAGPAWADLTAQDVWADWNTYISGMGYDVQATVEQSGGAVTVTALSVNMPIDDAGGTLAMTADRIEFRENGDGTVAIALPDTMPVRVVGTEQGDSFDITINLEQSGMDMTVAGSPNDLTYSYSAPTMAMRLASVIVDGEDLTANGKFEAIFNNVASTTRMMIGNMRSYSQDVTSESVSYSFAFDDPSSEDGGTMKGMLSGVGFKGSGDMPLEMNTADIQAMLKAGFAFDGSFTYGAGQTDMSGQGSGDVFQFSSTSQGGALRVAMSNSQVSYDVSQAQTAVNVAGSQIPFPVALEMADVGLKVMVPVSKSDEEQDFSLALKLGDFTMSDMIWSIFDAGSVLPRDPATIAIDLAGKAKVLVDLLDPAATEALATSETPPGELNALTIRDLLVSAVGAELTGTGDFTFDNSQMMPFGGMPKAVGGVDLTLVGANGLIDKLIQMGLVSDQDAMGARMMMGMLAVPGEGDDTLTSKLEINEEGHIMANGQRIQ